MESWETVRAKSQAVLKLNLNPNGVAAPAQRIARVASHAVATCLRALVHDDLTPPDMRGGLLGYNFPAPEPSAEECRKTYENWVLSKGFQDLARGIRETLEQAFLFLAMIRREPGMTTWEKVEAEIDGYRGKAQRLDIPGAA